jgi:hypothetical protein
MHTPVQDTRACDAPLPLLSLLHCTLTYTTHLIHDLFNPLDIRYPLGITHPFLGMGKDNHSVGMDN